jgi:hypothetical protein
MIYFDRFKEPEIYEMAFQHMITGVASAVVIVMATVVLGSVFNSFAATLEIPTYVKQRFL